MFRLLRCGIAAIVCALVIPAAAEAAVVSTWPLGSNAQDSVGSNDGTAHNVTFNGASAFFGGARVDSRITVPYTTTLSPGSQNVSATAQVNTTAMPGTGGLDFDIMRSARSGSYYKIELFPKNGLAVALCFFKGSLNHKQITGKKDLNDGNWHTITCTKTSSQITLTVDGVAERTAAIQIGSITHKTGMPFALGYKPLSGSGAEDYYIGNLRNASVTIG